jgi:hypothetical protein
VFRFGKPALSVCPTFGVASRGFWVCWRKLKVFFCAVILGELGAFASFFIVGVGIWQVYCGFTLTHPSSGTR